jgi:hypothetical protein
VTCGLSDLRGNLARMDTMTQDDTPTPETLEPATQNARYAELLRLVTSMEQDFRKFFDQGNKAAGTRVRQAMQELKSFAQNVRTEVLAMRSGPKE